MLAEGNVCSLRNGGEQGVGVASEINTADGWRRETLSEGWGKGGGESVVVVVGSSCLLRNVSTDAM